MMKFHHVCLLVLLGGIVVPSSCNNTFSHFIASYLNNSISRKQLIEAYDALRVDDKKDADKDLEAHKLSIKHLRNAEENKDTFRTLVELYAHHEIKRQDLINAYNHIENSDDRQLADQALTVRLKKTIEQLKKEELDKVPEMPFRPAFRPQPVKPSEQPNGIKPRTAAISRSAPATRAARPALEVRRAHTTPKPAPKAQKKETRNSVQLRIAYGPARSMHDLMQPKNKPFSIRAPQSRKKAPDSSNVSQKAPEAQTLPAKTVEPDIALHEEEVVARQSRLHNEEDSEKVLSPRSPRDWRTRAEEMRRRYAQLAEPSEYQQENGTSLKTTEQVQQEPRAEVLSKKRTANEQKTIDALQDQVAQSLLQQDQQKSADVPRQATRSVTEPVLPEPASSSSSAVPIMNAQEKAAEMKRRLTSLTGEKKYLIIDGVPYIKVGKHHYRPSQPEFSAQVAQLLDQREALQIGTELASINTTDKARWEFLQELLRAYTMPQAPKAHLKALMMATINNLEDKTVASYTKLPGELKIED